MTFREFLSDRLVRLIFHGAVMAAALAFLLATGTQSGVAVLLLIILLLIFALEQVIDFVKCRARLDELETIMQKLDKKYLFAECIPNTRNAYERRLLELFRRAGRHMVRAVSDAEAAQREYREYIESWVHEIKTPITAAGLICRSADPNVRCKLSPELAQIEAHVERALFYARAQNPEKDFIIRQTDLAEITAQALNQHRTLLMQSGVKVDADCLNQTVYTDGKWAAFIVGQLLQNAVRYRSEQPVLELRAKRIGQQVQLIVQDNGIGIPAHELPRIFDRGFTGSNGRNRGGSTGIGLYLSRKLADCLQIELQITSEAGTGTTVRITFPAPGKSVFQGNLTKM
ncbi:MAG: sensor histidine kinase [Candidatus Gastranaerophilales bacterium]|nr:sensor histidine kinase [Candidatus Gastranaerophilales bacterium]